MRVLFLDMDGVVNSDRYFRRRGARAYKGEDLRRNFVEMIDPATIPLLNEIVARGRAEVVISSSWRVPWQYGEIEAMLRQRGFVGNVIGSTPTRIAAPEPRRYTQRGTEIQVWLDNYPDAAGPEHVESFVILDDSDDMAHLAHRLVLTSWMRGLEPDHVEPAIRLLEIPR